MSFIVVSMLALLISISASSDAQVNAKPLNQNQVKFRRLPPKEFSASLGSSVTIECEAGASPPPTIHWLKNGQRILQNEIDENQLDDGQAIQVDDINRIALSSTRSRLFIDCADSQDEAIYTCVAENSFSRVSSNTKLNLIKASAAQLSSAGNADETTNLLDLELVDGTRKVRQELAAVPQCLNPLTSIRAEPVRIHMWTHNIVEVMKNDIVLYCRSNIKSKQQASAAAVAAAAAVLPAAVEETQTQNQQSHLSSLISSTSSSSSSSSLANINLNNQLNQEKKKQQQSQQQLVTWTTPDEKLISAEDRDKFEILETGDLLIKDLRWADMGSYICTVSDEQSSDSVSAFVYPAGIKAKNKRAMMSNSRY